MTNTFRRGTLLLVIEKHSVQLTQENCMPHQNEYRPTVDECEGKTIARINDSCENYLEIHFTDGTWIAWEVENLGCGFYGMIVQ